MFILCLQLMISSSRRCRLCNESAFSGSMSTCGDTKQFFVQTGMTSWGACDIVARIGECSNCA